MKIPAALALFPLALGAVEVELDFIITNEPGRSSRADVKYEIGTTSARFVTYEGIVNYTGNLLVNASIDASTGDMQSFEFTGGSIETSDVESTVLSPYVGSVPYTAFLSTNGIKRSPRSLDEDPLTGGVPNGGLHYTVFTDGSLTATNYITSFPTYDVVKATVPLADFRPYLIGADILFPVSLGIARGNGTPLAEEFEASLRSRLTLAPVFPPSYIRASGLTQSFLHEYNESGNIYADATYTVPSEYGQWALDNGLELETGEEVNESGMPYALLYAFDLPPGASSLPLSFSPDSGPRVTLALPGRGLGKTVKVEYSPDLSSGFTPLPAGNFVTGTDSLDAGSTEPAVLSFPAGGRGFLRFLVDL